MDEAFSRMFLMLKTDVMALFSYDTEGSSIFLILLSDKFQISDNVTFAVTILGVQFC